MNKFLIGTAAAVAVIGAGAAIAQTTAQPMMNMKHAHMAKAMTRADVQTHVQMMFSKLDTNRDGFITKAEAEVGKQQMHAKMAERRAQRAQGQGVRRMQMFDRLDANHDGMITRDEFAAAHAKGMGMHAGMMRRAGMMRMGGGMFERADLNKDGRVSLAEAQQAALAHFDAMDLNHDGTISPDERQQARQMRMQHKPR